MAEDRYAHLKVRAYKYWTVYLHEYQYFPGRVYIALNRDDDIDIYDVTGSEDVEKKKIVKKLKAAYKKVLGWTPKQGDRLNYQALSNDWHHCHEHITPRFAEDVKFGGVLFKDAVRGKNPSRAPSGHIFSPEVVDQIFNAMRKALA